MHIALNVATQTKNYQILRSKGGNQINILEHSQHYSVEHVNIGSNNIVYLQLCYQTQK